MHVLVFAGGRGIFEGELREINTLKGIPLRVQQFSFTFPYFHPGHHDFSFYISFDFPGCFFCLFACFLNFTFLEFWFSKELEIFFASTFLHSALMLYIQHVVFAKKFFFILQKHL